MLFHTYSFLLVFMPASLALYWGAARRSGLRGPALLAIGVAYYSFSGLPELILLWALAGLTFLAVREMLGSASPARRRASAAVVGANLLALLAFKLYRATPLSATGAELPLGLSFYTLNLVSYGYDVNARRTAQAPSFVSLASYATFFPTVASGPLLRFDAFEAQRASPRQIDPVLIEIGLLSFVAGLAKKLLIADPLGAAVDPLFANFEGAGLRESWLAILGYAYQLYFDFSGYTDMAIGVAALLGFRVPRNFDAPYTAVHITDFWQRWHMTMSRWFRDYLFLPLSRGLLRRAPSLDGSERIRALCLVLTMVAIGLWHGATWAFLAWGLYHGLLLAAHARVRTIRRLSVPVWAARILTFVAVLVGWVLLRSPSPGMAWRIWEGMVGLHGWGGPLTGLERTLTVVVVLLMVVTSLRLEVRLAQPRGTVWQSWAVAMLLVLSLLAMGHPSPFLYLQF